MVLHPVQLVPLLADHSCQVHEHCVYLGNLLLQPHHVLVSVQAKEFSMKLKRLIVC